MNIDIDAIFNAIARAQDAFNLVRDLADDVAAVLSNAGQPELQARLEAMREANDADRARREGKLDAAAKN